MIKPDFPTESQPPPGRWRGRRKLQGTYISVIVSGRFVGISVRPFPRQSTILLLQVQAAGQCNTLQEGAINDWWPAKNRNAAAVTFFLLNFIIMKHASSPQITKQVKHSALNPRL